MRRLPFGFASVALVRSAGDPGFSSGKSCVANRSRTSAVAGDTVGSTGLAMPWPAVPGKDELGIGRQLLKECEVR